MQGRTPCQTTPTGPVPSGGLLASPCSGRRFVRYSNLIHFFDAGHQAADPATERRADFPVVGDIARPVGLETAHRRHTDVGQRRQVALFKAGLLSQYGDDMPQVKPQFCLFHDAVTVPRRHSRQSARKTGA